MKNMLLVLLAVLMMASPVLAEENTMVETSAEPTKLDDGLYAVQLSGEEYLEDFLARGGASSDMQVVQFLAGKLLFAANDLPLNLRGFGCTAFTVPTKDGGRLFGRNFDWYSNDTWIVEGHPDKGYASIATVNMGFLGGNVTAILPDSARALAAYYAPLDGMNEKGLCVAVLYIEDRAQIDQQTDLPDLTTTTVVRTLLNQAATVEEAVALLRQYDFHASMGMTIHFAIADAAGNMVVVDYVNNEMIVTETQALTNFYLAQGEKYGIGSGQSHNRFDTVQKALADHETMTASDVRDVLDSVSKHNFNDGETTEWSMVCDQANGTVTYYHREDYSRSWTLSLR